MKKNKLIFSDLVDKGLVDNGYLIQVLKVFYNKTLSIDFTGGITIELLDSSSLLFHKSYISTSTFIRFRSPVRPRITVVYLEYGVYENLHRYVS